MSRTLSPGTPTPVCHGGRAYPVMPFTALHVKLGNVPAGLMQLLGPPPPPTRFRVLAVTPVQPESPACAHESFHVISGMYDKAEFCNGEEFVGLQNWDWLPASSKSVPPTATLNGVEATPLTDRPACAVFSLVKASHAADPLSPEATSTVMPCAAACSHMAL